MPEVSGVFTSFFDEHRLILRVTDAFERYLHDFPVDTPESRQDLQRFVVFFREYADLIHHEKEESILLPAMVYAGCDWEGHDLKQVRDDHKQERYLMRSLRQTAAQRGLWTGEDLRHLNAVGQELVDFQRAHMERETVLLYPAARVHIVGEHAEKMQEALDDFERIRGDRDNWLVELAEELIRDHPLPARRPAQA